MASTAADLPTVVHVKRDDYDLYIGRENPKHGLKESKWANPYKIGEDGTREEVLEKYYWWLLQQPDLLASLHELYDKRIACWCKPKACHGDILREFAEIYRSLENKYQRTP
jgi:hypothetical protein